MYLAWYSFVTCKYGVIEFSESNFQAIQKAYPDIFFVLINHDTFMYWPFLVSLTKTEFN